MALINTYSIAFLVFIIGLSCNVHAEKSPCTGNEFESCADNVTNMASADMKDLCNGILADAKKCWHDINMTCEMPAYMADAMNTAIMKIDESLAGCPNASQPKTDDDKTPQCDAAVPQNCIDMMSEGDGFVFCRAVEKAVPCLEDAIEQCKDEVKKGLQEKYAAVQERMKAMKCCNEQRLKECKYIDINNETASDEKCMELAKNKACVEEEMKTCGEEKYVKQLEEFKEGSTEGLEICKNKGYKIVVEDDDHDHDHTHHKGGNGGVPLEPTLVLLLSVLSIQLASHGMF